MLEARPAPGDTGDALDLLLARDSLFVCDLKLCQVRLQNDRRWPWLVLVPRGGELVEIEDLSPPERAALMEEVVAAGRAVRMLGAALGFEVEKLNVGALGNVVRQLHVHVVGRRPKDDAGGKGPVWGLGVAEPYADADADRERALAVVRSALR